MIAQRGEPVFFVRLKPSPQVAGDAHAPSTKRLRDATNYLASARANMASFLVATGGPGAIASSSDPLVHEYLEARKHLRLATAAYNAALAQARSAAQPAATPTPPTPDLTESVLSFEYEEDEKKADQLTLTLRNDDLAYFDSPLFEKGTTLHVGWGYVGALAPAREVVVQKVTGARTLKVVAQSKSVLMQKTTRVRSFERKTRSEIARAIAEEYGYGAAQQDIDETRVRHGVLAQSAQTDAQFLKRLADQEGFEFYVDFDGFHWHARRLQQRPVRVLTYYFPPNVGDITDFNIENDVTAKPGAVNVKGKDPLTKKPLDAKADNASTKRNTLAPIIDIVDRRTGEKTTKLRAVASSETRPTSETSAAAAKTEADAIFRRTQQTAVQLTLEMVGDPYLVTKSVVEVRGLGKRLSGKYYVASLKHTIGSSGYTVAAKLKTDGTQAGVAKSKGTPNKAEAAKSSEQGALTPVTVVNRRTGEKRTVLKDTRGRAASG